MIKNVKRADLNSLIAERKTTIEKYMDTWQSQQFEEYPNTPIYFLEKDWLSDVIPENELIRDTKQGKALFISAQTGSGKTTFIFDRCLPIAKAKGRKILYLCSRNALCKQIKSIAMNHPENGEEFAKELGWTYKVKDLKKFFTDDGLKGRFDFGLIDIATYQSYLYNPSMFNEEKYEFIVADECHFFTTDSLYNPSTEIILHNIIDQFDRCTRIYLTATPQECLEEIYAVEKESHTCSKNHQTMTIFSMAHDYNYMNPIFFSKTKEILELIKVRSDESWLIFVRNKNVGEHIQQELTNYGLRVDYFTADTEKDDIAYCELLEKEHLPGNISITTRVLDVGINVKGGSPKAFNIVVYEDDIVEIQQMIGRKRVEKNEILNVYFYTPSLSELEKRRISVFYRDMEFGRFKELSENGCYLESIHPPFFLEGNMLKYNNFFPHKVANDIFHYNDLINKISEVDGVPAQQIRYAEEMLSNFEGITVNESPVFITDLDKELKKLLRETDGKTLLKGEFETFSQCIKTLYGDPRSKKRDTPLGVNNVKSILKELGYMLTTAGNPVTYTIEKEET